MNANMSRLGAHSTIFAVGDADIKKTAEYWAAYLNSSKCSNHMKLIAILWPSSKIA